MTSQIMKHEEAVSSLAVERYLLGEMRDDERSAFEAHCLSCAECLEAVTFADEFMEQAPLVARQIRAQEAAANVPVRNTPGSFFARLLAGLKGPAPAWALVLILSAVAVYQAVDQPKGAFSVSHHMLTGPAHGVAEPVRATQDSVMSLGLEYERSGEYLSYRAKILSESGVVKASVTMPADQTGNTAWIDVMPNTLDPGRYSIVVMGKKADGTEKEVGREAFELQFADN